jgi:hypothetical protein
MAANAGDIGGRSDDEMKALLASLTPSLQVMPAKAHGENNCLIDCAQQTMLRLIGFVA